MFQAEQEEYEEDEIDWRKISFVDNQATLDLLADKPLNLFALIYEETSLAGRGAAELIAKIKTTHTGNPLFQIPHASANRGLFGALNFACATAGRHWGRDCVAVVRGRHVYGQTPTSADELRLHIFRRVALCWERLL